MEISCPVVSKLLVNRFHYHMTHFSKNGVSNFENVSHMIIAALISFHILKQAYPKQIVLLFT